jgi:hypothetical protein
LRVRKVSTVEVVATSKEQALARLEAICSSKSWLSVEAESVEAVGKPVRAALFVCTKTKLKH